VTKHRRRKIVAGSIALLFAMSLCFVPFFHISGGPCIFGTFGFIPIWELHEIVDFGHTTPPEQMTIEALWMSSGSSGIFFPILALQWVAIGLVVFVLHLLLLLIGKKQSTLTAEER